MTNILENITQNWKGYEATDILLVWVQLDTNICVGIDIKQYIIYLLLHSKLP